MKLFAFLLAISLASPAIAAQAVGVSVEALARESDLVVRGRVVSVASRWSDDRRLIFTTASVRATRTLRGAAPRRLDVIVPGGVVGSIGQRVDAAPTLAAGDEVVLFLVRGEAGTYRVSGLAQGKFAIEGGTARPDLSRFAFVAVRVGEGERRVEAMPLSDLERRVRGVR